MKEQIGPLLVVLLIGLAAGCVVIGLAAYDRVLSRKQINEARLGAIVYTTGSWVFLILVAVCIVTWVFY